MSLEGAAGWARRSWRALLGEALGTALLVGLGVASLLPRQLPDGRLEPAPLAHPAMAFGFLVIALVEVFGPVSGAHLNPAVTLAALIYGKISSGLAAAYAVAQGVGAFGGLLALAAAAPSGALAAARAGCTLPGAGVAAAGAAGVEAALTALLALVACALWAAPRPDPAAPVKLGLTVAGLVYAGGHLSAASINPARSLAPAAYAVCFSSHWVYWLGPLLGAALGASLHRWVLTAPPASASAPAPAAAPLPEELPLHEKRDAT